MAAVIFASALGRCGFLLTPIQYFNAIGLDADTLVGYTGEDYSSMITGLKYYRLPAAWNQGPAENGPMIISPPALRKLKGFQRWLKFRQLRGEGLAPERFVNALVPIWAERQALIYREVKEGGTETDVASPSKLKRLRGWKTFELDLLTYLSQVRGITSTFLVYLTREHKDPTAEMLAGAYHGDDAMYDDIDQALADTIKFTSADAKHDNRKLYFILTALFKDGEAHIYTKKHSRTKDGRQAYIEARRAALGNVAKTTDVAQANAVINTSKYTGDKKSYTFEAHVARFQSAYNDLEINENPVAPETQVAQFLASISERKMVNARPTILAHATMNSDLTECIAFLQSVVANDTKEQQTQSRDRSIGAATRERGSGWGKKIVARNYTNEEIALFTTAEKELLKKVRKEERQKEGKLHRKRVAKKVTVDDVSSSEESTEDDAPADQFGRHGDKRKSAKIKKRSKK